MFLLAISQDSLHKELLVVKDKWKIIGVGLEIPHERLDQFNDIADPLLEIIVHWLKGARGVPPSWDIIVATLRDPSVNETELADKIQRVYCQGEDKAEIKELADSGT